MPSKCTEQSREISRSTMREKPHEKVVIHRKSHLAINAANRVVRLAPERKRLLRKPWHTREKPMRHQSQRSILENARILVHHDAIAMHERESRFASERVAPGCQRPRQMHVIGIEPRENIAGCELKSARNRGRLSTIGTLFDVREMLSKARDHRIGAVGRTTIHHDDFEIFIALGEQTRKRVAEPTRLIETRHDNRDSLGMHTIHACVPAPFER
jgi:hypothetical protein